MPLIRQFRNKFPINSHSLNKTWSCHHPEKGPKKGTAYSKHNIYLVFAGVEEDINCRSYQPVHRLLNDILETHASTLRYLSNHNWLYKTGHPIVAKRLIHYP